jgi:hypothetical protein
MEVADWIDEVLEEPEKTHSFRYLSHRFNNLDISKVTVENYEKMLTESLADQISMFIAPSGSFKTPDLQRYLELLRTYETSTNDLILGFSLADQIRITFSDMLPATICEKFPDIDLMTKRRYRCVAEYLIRQGELAKVKDESGKLVKKVGNMGKAVVIYQPLTKIRQTLQRSGLTDFIKNDKTPQGNDVKVEPSESESGKSDSSAVDD